MIIDLNRIHAVLQEQHNGLYVEKDQGGYSDIILTQDQLSDLATVF